MDVHKLVCLYRCCHIECKSGFVTRCEDKPSNLNFTSEITHLGFNDKDPSKELCTTFIYILDFISMFHHRTPHQQNRNKSTQFNVDVHIFGWRFGTFFIFPYIGNVIIPTDFHIFQMGWNHQPDIYIIWYFICNIHSVNMMFLENSRKLAAVWFLHRHCERWAGSWLFQSGEVEQNVPIIHRDGLWILTSPLYPILQVPTHSSFLKGLVDVPFGGFGLVVYLNNLIY